MVVALNAWTPINIDVVLLAWGLGEAKSEKPDHVISTSLDPGIVTSIRAGHALTTEQEETVKDNLLIARRGMLHDLLRLQPDWYRGQMGADELGRLRIYNESNAIRKAGGSRDMTALMLRGDLNEPMQFVGDPGKLSEPPIGVGKTLDGPFCLIDGYNRCRALLRDHHSGRRCLDHISFIVGVTNRIAEYRWW